MARAGLPLLRAGQLLLKRSRTWQHLRHSSLRCLFEAGFRQAARAVTSGGASWTAFCLRRRVRKGAWGCTRQNEIFREAKKKVRQSIGSPSPGPQPCLGCRCGSRGRSRCGGARVEVVVRLCLPNAVSAPFCAAPNPPDKLPFRKGSASENQIPKLRNVLWKNSP